MESKSKFLKIVCPRCRQRHIVFGKSSLSIKCRKCNYLLTKPAGGKTKIRAMIEAILWR
ncbi:MAG: 30S ribosomal protein S27e [Nanoarchaeota archaeon]|nr:30S ribosomal protein S27e [Nanoarchaeota archaeon]